MKERNQKKRKKQNETLIKDKMIRDLRSLFEQQEDY